MIEKNLVKRRFERSFEDYDKNAAAQKLIADKLFEILVKYCGNTFNNVFEIGCGTGIFTSKLSELHIQKLILNDLSEHAAHFNTGCDFLHGDAEIIDYPANLDLIVSSSTVQWFDDFENFLLKAYNSLNTGAYLVFSTFLCKNFSQIGEVFNVSLNYLTSQKLKELSQKHFELVCFDDEIFTFYFKDLEDILRHLKHTGTNSLKAMRLTRSSLLKYRNLYKKLAAQKGLPLTYNPAYIVLRKVC